MMTDTHTRLERTEEELSWVGLALAVVIGAIAAIIALPVFVIRHLHGHRAPHAHALVHRLAQLGREDSALAASRVRRIAARAQATLHSGPLS